MPYFLNLLVRSFTGMRIIRMKGGFILFVCYSNCSTCQKARKLLEANNVAFEERHIKERIQRLMNERSGTRRTGC